MLANKHTRNSRLLSNPSDHAARGVPDQNTPVRTPLWSTMMKASITKQKWTPEPQKGRRERFWTIRPVSSRINLSTPPPRPPPMVTSLLDQSKVIIQLMKDGNGERTFELGKIVTHGIQTPKTKPTKYPATRLSHS
ncbi:hypothetical protein O181_008617 [Austropuccinia psidii MF-1]|uniref:Uncharacterized protein n=1 Tax=Austropuccinia psidii MF-1 TaxID=1389203 RepID=A0A9Q3BQ38_9BASI|nr:hypothetical protein [Austropuccinia psidii MF-1]